MDDVSPNARVLVAIVNRLRDLAAARDQGWYRIPLARAPRALHAEYLAFYQTAVFGSERWAVRYLAPVRAVSIATRAALLPAEAGHPRASERYYRLAIGPLMALAVPVLSRRLRRIAFIPTTIGQLLRARDLNELWHPDEDAADGWEGLWGAGVNRRG
ncbi:MAG: hypothetical protein ABIV47_26170 [Roseiflexaceae bacterium]